jgi:ABC-2 type transport system ATP-binding protein
MDAVSTAGLRKTFGRRVALDHLDLRVPTGEVHGLLGPNGAGKSTTLRILLGLLRADAGHVELLGADPWRDAAALHRRLAFVPGEVALWPNLSAGEVVDLLGRLHGGQDARRRAELVERFDLDERSRCGSLSTGNRRKVALVAAFSCDAELLLLDEPTAGLDPLGEQQFQRTVREVRAQGRTVLLSSHVLSEVEALCDRVSIVRAGRVVETGTLSALRHLTRTHVAVRARRAPTGLDRLAVVHDLTLDHTVEDDVTGGGTGVDVRFSVDQDGMGAVLEALRDSGVTDLTSTPTTLEELFLRHYDQHDDQHDDQAGAR